MTTDRFDLRWHGCSCPNGQRNGNSAQLLNAAKKKRTRIQTLIKNPKSEVFGAEYIEVWECDFDRLLKSNPQLKTFRSKFVKTLRAKKPLNPREAMRGGKTNSIQHRVFCGEDETILYLDFTSLYPSVNACLNGEAYPLGHPQVLLSTEVEEKLGSWDKAWGLIHCSVLPPKQLLHPCLPFRCKDKLLFPLCRSCAETQHQGFCTHQDKDRRLTGHWVTEELKEAVRLGYQVHEVYEVWHWPEDQRSSTIFEDFILDHYLDKEYASGFPPGCDTEETKLEHALQVKEVLRGRHVDVHKFSKNEGLRSLAKLMINNSCRPSSLSLSLSLILIFFKEKCTSNLSEIIDLRGVHGEEERRNFGANRGDTGGVQEDPRGLIPGRGPL